MKILYKALTTDGKWIKGLPRYDSGWAVAIVAFEECRGRVYENVFRDSIVPFVGLTDKNGVEMFCGDIVKHYNAYSLGNHNNYIEGEIFWDERQCCFKIRHLNKEGFYFIGTNEYHISNDCVYEVVGNIYDKLVTHKTEASWDEPKANIPHEVQELAEAINEFFGSDSMYYGVDGLAIAHNIVEMGLVKNGEWMYLSENPLKDGEIALIATTREHFYVNDSSDTQKGCRGEICCYLPLKRIK